MLTVGQWRLFSSPPEMALYALLYSELLIALIKVAASTLYQTTRRYNPKHNHAYTRHRDSLKLYFSSTRLGHTFYTAV
jgi:hypothetical protein